MVLFVSAVLLTSCGSSGIPQPPSMPPHDITGVLITTPSINPDAPACYAVPNRTGYDYHKGDPITVDTPVGGVFSHEVEIIATGHLESPVIGQVCEFRFTMQSVPSQLSYHIRVGTDEWLIPRDDIEEFGWNIRLSTNTFDCEQESRYISESCYGPDS